MNQLFLDNTKTHNELERGGKKGSHITVLKSSLRAKGVHYVNTRQSNQPQMDRTGPDDKFGHDFKEHAQLRLRLMHK